MRKVIFVLSMFALAAIFAACKDDQQSAAQGESVVSGVVQDKATLDPVSGVSIQAQGVSMEGQSTSTDAQGKFTLNFTLDSTAAVTLSFTKSGYRDTTVVVQVQSGVFVSLNPKLAAKSPVVGGGGTGTGIAQTIAFLSADPQEISVYGVGGLETTVLGWEVRDSLGLPIDGNNSVTLSFTAISGPNGGEYISPLAVASNAVGQVFTTFNSGVRSGVVQIIASADVPGKAPISTAPVRVVINAGYPDQAHFTVGPARHNFPTLFFVFGLRNPISVLVGDIYSNPVVPNTALYFRSSAGVVEATIFTNEDGEGTTDLISGNPQPLGQYATPVFGDGYHYVAARTIGQGGVGIEDSTLILWSGLSQIKNVSPTTFDIPNGGSDIFNFNVSDYLGHPLAGGTRISVTVSIPPPPCPDCPQNQVHSSFGFAGSGSVTLDDIIFPGPGTTDFSFVLSDGSTGIDAATPVTVAISVSSPNGNVGTAISGTVH